MHLRRWVTLLFLAAFVVAGLACGSQDRTVGWPMGDAGPQADAPEDTGKSDVGRDALEAKDGGTGDSAQGAQADASGTDGSSADAQAGDSGGGGDAATGDAPAPDATPDDAATLDAGTGDVVTTDSPTGIITGGPCVSGATGATAYRVQFVDGGGTAYVQYEVDGLPDQSRDDTGAYGYDIGFSPSYVDPFLAQGGLALDDTDFVDIEISTAGLSSISSATLSILGRSYSVDTNGSYYWETFDGTGSTPIDSVSNVPPYQWYSTDVTGGILPGDNGVLLRIKAGGSSGALVVNQIELCFVAQ